MPLPSHGRYGYSALPERPVYDWPGGKRLAVYLGLNLETFAFGEGLGARLAPAAGDPDVLNFSWRDYGNRVGAWRLLELFETLGFPASVLVNSALYDEAPELIAAFRARGDEIVGHGRTNSEQQGALSEADERGLIAEATRADCSRLKERRPRAGWDRGFPRARRRPTCSPRPVIAMSWIGRWTISRSSFACAAAGGCSRFLIRRSSTTFPPSSRARRAGADFAEMIVDAFDEMREQSNAAPLVMGIALHPYIVGHPHRLRPLRRALGHIASAHEKIWITTAGAIAEHCLGMPPGVVP